MFKTVAREPNLTSRVTSQMEALIVDNQLQPGDRLPAVKELAEKFGVSRTVIREAVGALAAKGLLEVRHGSRTVVRHPSVDTVTQSMSLYLRAGLSAFNIDKVSQVRRVLEVEIAGCAAEQRTEKDLRRLEMLLAEMEKIVTDPTAMQTQGELYIQTDVNFHTALADATHNELFPLLLNSLVDIMLEVRKMGLAVPGSPQNAIDFHRAIYLQVKAGNMEGARQAMREHLTDSEEVMRQAIALRSGKQ